LKNQTTSWGIEPATFRIAAQWLNKLAWKNFFAARPLCGGAPSYLKKKRNRLVEGVTICGTSNSSSISR
jgi:hypothetical protein